MKEDYFKLRIEKYDLKDSTVLLIYFTKAIELDPNNPSAYHNRGLAKYKLKDYKGAINDYDKAMKIKNSLEITRLADILDTSEIYWDNGIGTSIEEDKKILEIYGS